MDSTEDSLFRFSEQDVQSEIENILAIQPDNVSPVDIPRAIILGGQPGAGKTTLADVFTGQLDNNAIFISGDAYRKLHPNSTAIIQKYGRDGLPLMSAFSGAVTERLIEYTSKQKFNLVIEGTLRTTEVPLKTCRLLKQNGYQVDLACMAVKPLLSYFSTLLRYEMMQEYGTAPRATPKEAHDHVVAQLGPNLDSIELENVFDRILLYTRTKYCIYDSSIMNTPPSVVLKSIHEGDWSIPEIAQLRNSLGQTEHFMRQRNAPELSDFLTEAQAANYIIETCVDELIEEAQEMEQ
jgi:UDP-N-acetylglucosamine kinase